MAPVALFAYYRDIRPTTTHLAKNPEACDTDLFVFIDGPRHGHEAAVGRVRKQAEKIVGFRSVSVSAAGRNQGMSSLPLGVGFTIAKTGRLIVLEDDMIVSPFFLRFMNEALDRYQSAPAICGIHGYVPPLALPETFVRRGTDCWGWATWKEKWDYRWDAKRLFWEILPHWREFNQGFTHTRHLFQAAYGNLDSWAIRWRATTWLKNQYMLYPGRSLVQNIGSNGTHTKSVAWLETELSPTPIVLGNPGRADKKLRDFYRKNRPRWYKD